MMVRMETDYSWGWGWGLQAPADGEILSPNVRAHGFVTEVAKQRHAGT